jgi:hypothetical protein
MPAPTARWPVTTSRRAWRKTYGVKTASHPIAMKIGKPVFKAMAKDAPDYISSVFCTRPWQGMW